MSNKCLNMIECLNKAWEIRQKTNYTDYEEQFKNLILPSYMNLLQSYMASLEKEKKQYNHEIFIAYNVIILKLIMADGDFLQGEYDEYAKFAEECGYEPLTIDVIKEKNKEIDNKVIKETIDLIKNSRSFIGEEEFYQLVVGMCYLSLSGDKELDEEEYNIIKLFFDEGVDHFPSNFKELKSEWK